MYGTSLATVPPQEPRRSAHEQLSLQSSFKGTPGFPAAFCLTQMDGMPADFHRQVWVSSPGIHAAAGERSVGLGPLLLWGNICS